MPPESISSGSQTEIPDIALWAAWLPVIVLISLLAINVSIFADDATFGSNQIALWLAALVAGIVGRFYGVSFDAMAEGIARSVHSAMSAILILLVIGALIGTWMISGIVPGMVWLGLKLLSPEYFLFAAACVSAIVALASGSSWSTVATVGVASLGVAKALGVSEAWAAGAVISGAYFGDKISPLSDTTNLAAAMVDVPLFVHIRHMLWTTVPSMAIALAVYLAVGWAGETQAVNDQADTLLQAIDQKFWLSPWLAIVPLTVFGLVLCRVHALAALLVGTLMGGLFAVVFQPDIIREIATALGFEGSYLKQAYSVVVETMANKVTLDSENSFATELLQGKGMSGMLNTVWLIISAMTFGGVMETCGLLQRITRSLMQFAKSTGSLIATTAGSCLFINVTASDQYLAIVVPGRMFKQAYQDRGLAGQNLSRTLEDSGTVTSVLVPWNTCGAFQAGTLDVATLAFAPFCLFNWISPLMTIAFGFLGIGIKKTDGSEPVEIADSANQKI
jgi:NhaC family Na+:H+ antiporter